MSNTIFLVNNIYQGHHYVASTLQKAKDYISSKITHDGSCWDKENWQIEEQKLDSKVTFSQGE